METGKNKDYDPQGDYSQEDSKEYPGYTSDRHWGNTNDESAENTTKREKIEDARLADSGPVRNPNYHDLTDTKNSGSENSNSSNSYSALKEKTLEDFNETDPKRDLNKTDLNSDQSEYTDNDQSNS